MVYVNYIKDKKNKNKNKKPFSSGSMRAVCWATWLALLYNLYISAHLKGSKDYVKQLFN